MSKRLTTHAEVTNERNVVTQTMCGIRGLPASRFGRGWSKITCNRCRKIGNVGQLWAKVQPKKRKPPKRMIKVADIVRVEAAPLRAGSGGDFPGVSLIDYSTLQALRQCDTDPRKFPMLRIDIKGYPSRDVPNPIYVPPESRHLTPKLKALGRGLDSLLATARGELVPVPEAVPNVAYLNLLEVVHRYAGELCDAIDAAEEDIGGSRAVKDILGDLGPAVTAVEDFKRDAISKRVQDENEG